MSLHQQPRKTPDNEWIITQFDYLLSFSGIPAGWSLSACLCVPVCLSVCLSCLLSFFSLTLALSLCSIFISSTPIPVTTLGQSLSHMRPIPCV